MKDKYIRQKDTRAWVLQVWVSFILAVSSTAVGVFYLPVDNWVKGFMGIGLTFCIGSSFTLAKTIRDNQEFQGLSPKIDEA